MLSRADFSRGMRRRARRDTGQREGYVAITVEHSQ